MNICLIYTFVCCCISAQSPALPCPAPSLNGGYWVPEHEAYSDGTKIFYACDKGLKPAVEGCWGTATCQNGSWSHKPQCIGKCFVYICTGLSEAPLKPKLKLNNIINSQVCSICLYYSIPDEGCSD